MFENKIETFPYSLPGSSGPAVYVSGLKQEKHDAITDRIR